MPERINKLLTRVDSAEVQGEGSYVLMKAPTIGDIREGQLPDTADKMANMDFAVSLLSKLVQEWNWVDDDGNPLPAPSAAVINGLPYAEIKFLMDALDLEGLADQKN
jgi:hypothetical protein